MTSSLSALAQIPQRGRHKGARPGGRGLPESYVRFASWSEGIRAHANRLGAYCGAAPVSGPGGEPVRARYRVAANAAWAGAVRTTDGLLRKWSIRGDYARVLHEGFLDPLRRA